MTVCKITQNFKRDNVKCVICKSDGLIKYCNSLSIDGTCVSKNYICGQAVAIIAEKDRFTHYLAVEH